MLDSQKQMYFGILRNWLQSKERAEMQLAKRYYAGYQDILGRERTVINADGALSPVNNLPNNKIVDNIFSRLVDQKVNYALGKPMIVSTADDEYREALETLYDRKFHRQLRLLGEEAVLCGIAYLYVYLDEQGEFKIKVFPGDEVLPIWADESHTELAMAIRVYNTNILSEDGTTLENHDVVEIYTTDGIDRFVNSGTKLSPYPGGDPHINYLKRGNEEFNWEHLPVIPFKYNSKEIPLIRRVKGLQDSLNEVMSDYQNNMEEDPRNTILILKNYDGQNLAEFRRNLATYGCIKVQTVDGSQGGVEALNVEVNAQNYQTLLTQLKRAAVENGRGFDAKEERMDGDPNQMNIESMYTDIDLDVDQMETEFQYGFDELKFFIDSYFETKNIGSFSDSEVDFTFNRDIFINEDAIINNCVQSAGLISQETMLGRHPWVKNVAHELELLKKDQERELEEMEATMRVEAKNIGTGKPANAGSSTQSKAPRGNSKNINRKKGENA